MLARLEAEPSVQRAEADLHGEMLRIRLTEDAQLTRVLEVLEHLGFAALRSEEDIGTRSWYGAERVRELSRAEGRIIAERVIALFAEEHEVLVTDELVEAVAVALYECFVSHDVDADVPAAVLRGAWAEATRRAATTHLGDDLAAALGAAVEADLASRGTGGVDR